MKKNLLLACLSTSCIFFAQQSRVGINTATPKTTLDVTAVSDGATRAEGIMIPRLTGDQVVAMTANLTAENHSMMVFVTSPAASAEDTNLNFPGYYRFNYTDDGGTVTKSWVRLEPSGLERTSDSSGKEGYKLVNSNFAEKVGINAVNLQYLTKDLKGGIDFNSTAYTQQEFYDILAGLDPAFTYYGVQGPHSIAAGLFNSTKEFGSAAFGGGNRIRGYASMSSGLGNKVDGDLSLVAGYLNYSRGIGSMVVGYNNSIKSEHSYTIGQNNSSTGKGDIFLFGNELKIGNEIESRNVIILGFDNYVYPSGQIDPLFIVANGGRNSLVIDKSSKTGIGLPADDATPVNPSTPTEMLDVNGNIRTRTINANAGTGADKIVLADANGVLKTSAENFGNFSSKFTNNTTDKNIYLTNLSNGSTPRSGDNQFIIADDGGFTLGSDTSISWPDISEAWAENAYFFIKNDSPNLSIWEGKDIFQKISTVYDSSNQENTSSIFEELSTDNYNLFFSKYSGDRRFLLGYSNYENANRLTIGEGIKHTILRGDKIDISTSNGLLVNGDQMMEPTESVDVNGNIRVRGTGAEPTGACANPGSISYYNDNFYGCTTTGWRKLSFAP